MLKLSALALALGFFALPLGANAQQAMPGMLRVWNGSGTGVVRVAVFRSGNGYAVHLWGACSPTPCDWGVRPLGIYGGNVGATLGTFGFATYATNFSVTRVILKYQGFTLRVRTFTHFTDSSGRSDYTGVTILR